MKIYHAGADRDLKVMIQSPSRQWLISIAGAGRGLDRALDVPTAEVLIDSGAFTFARTGETPTPREWLRMVEPYAERAHEVFSLDVIGDGEASWRNYLEIRKTLPDVIPTYHVGSDVRYLRQMLEVTDRIGIGGVARLVWGRKHRAPLIRDLRGIASLAMQERPTARLHLFGVISQDIHLEVPFYSCDSTTWVISGANKGLVTFSKDGLRQVNHTTLTRHQSAEYLKSRIERNLAAIRAIDQYERYITNLWTKRGITWQK